MSIETRVRQTGNLGGGAGGAAGSSSGLAGTAPSYILNSGNATLPNSLIIKAGSSVLLNSDATAVYITAITGVAAGSGGLAGTGNYYIVGSAQPLLPGSRILSAGSSITMVTDATSFYVTALTPNVSTFISSTGGLAGTGAYYLLTSGNSTLPNASVYSSALIGYRDLQVQAAKLYASTSAARIDAGTSIWRLLFSATTQQFGVWQWILPRDYSGSPFVRILWGNDSGMAVAKSASWIVDQWGSLPNLNSSAYVDTFGGTNITTVALSAGYSSGTIQTMTIPLATVVSMNVGNLIRLRVSGSGAIGNLEAFGINFEYTRI